MTSPPETTVWNRMDRLAGRWITRKSNKTYAGATIRSAPPGSVDTYGVKDICNNMLGVFMGQPLIFGDTRYSDEPVGRWERVWITIKLWVDLEIGYPIEKLSNWMIVDRMDRAAWKRLHRRHGVVLEVVTPGGTTWLKIGKG